MKTKVYDIIGIGIGPFNLGMAALADSIPELNCVFIDQEKTFSWHPGMLLPNTYLQVPFYADLVTLADPQSKYSFLSYLKAKQRLFRFAIHENNFVSRIEYNDYCQWVCSQLSNLRFSQRCESVQYNEETKVFDVYIKEVVSNLTYIISCKHIVIGIGTTPTMPSFANDIYSPSVLHSSKYVFNRDLLHAKNSITVVGSGQSAAEIFYDLLNNSQQFKSGINWFTSSDRFYPMEYSKLSLEMTSGDYISHFFALNAEKKKHILSNQNMLYKGINYNLINSIYDELYRQSLQNPVPTRLLTNTVLTSIKAEANNELNLQFTHKETEQSFVHKTNAVILATGYGYQTPSFIEPINHLIDWTADGQFNVAEDYSISSKYKDIFVQNAELHTHGFNSPDLGMGPYRNAIILNTILGYERFSIEKNIAFQTFGIPKD